VLIDVVIAAVSEQEGAFDLDGALELVDEVAHLNPKRHRSYFHLGFVDALAARPIGTDRFPEANESRVGWYLAGAILGLARRGEYAAIAELWTANQTRAKGMLDGSHDGASEALPVLFDAVFRARSPSDAFALLDGGGIARAGRRFVGRLLHEIARLVQSGRAVEARRVLEEVQYGILLMVEEGTEVPDSVTSEVDRRVAQCHQIQGEFDEAVEGFERLLPNARPEQAGAAEVDLGLAKCRLRGLGDLRIPEEESDWPMLATRLKPSEPHLRRSLEFESSRRAHAEYCLGVYALAQDDLAAAQPHLERALVELAARPETYGPLGVLPRLRLYLGYCLAAGGDPIRSDESVRLVEEAVKELPPTEGTSLIARTVEYLAMSAPDAAGRLAASLHGARGEALLRAACEGQLLRRHPELCDALAQRAADDTRSSRARFTDWCTVLRESLAASRLGHARDALDALEEIAQEPALREEFETLLTDSRNYDPAWSHDDAELARVTMLEATGQVGAAAAVLKQLGHAAISRGGPQAVEIALAYLERLATYGGDHDVGDLRDRVDAVERQLARSQGTAAQPSAQVKGVVYVVGGNESQARQEQAIRETVARSWPGVRLEFVFTGWSSNWQKRLDGFERQLRDADAVVLLQFVRTTLGQTVRRICGEESIPWIPCTGHGRQSIVGAIARAADVLARSACP
jgi:tetratricopeptide (TPR) repeat protein